MSTLVVLVAPPDSSRAAVGDDPVAAQLHRLPVRGGLRVQPVAGGLGPILDAIDAADGPVAIMSAQTRVEDAALLRILDDPSLSIATLVRSVPGGHPVATQADQVLTAGTARHPVPGADADGAGVVYLSSALAPAAAATLRAMFDDLGRTDDPVDFVLAALTRSGDLPGPTAVRAEPFRAIRADRGVSADESAEIEPAGDPATDRDREARTAARPGDGWYSTFVLRRLSRRLTPWAVRHGMAATTVTVISALLGLGGAALFAVGTWPALAAGAVALQISIVLDCVDGEIARATRTRSRFGGWLDAVTDRVKEYAALAGLAFAGHHLWPVAGAAMVVQTMRHVQDYAFDKGVLAGWRAGMRDARPLRDTTAWSAPAGAVLGAAPLTGSVRMWVRRVIRMPIGERWLVLCLAALADRPWLGLWAYLVLAVVAEAWSLLGALRRTRGLPAADATLRRTLAGYRDDGILAIVTGRFAPPGLLGWALPVKITLIEGAAVVATTAAVAPRWSAAAFGWFALVAWHRYDTVYAVHGRAAASPRLISALGGGWLVRIAALLIAAATGGLPVVLVVGICWLALVYLPPSLLAGARLAGDSG